MDFSVSSAIREWFTVHNDDGEFSFADWNASGVFVPPPYGAPKVVYSTKPFIAAHGLTERSQLQAGIVGAYGLPSDSDMTRLRKIVVGKTLLFLGDMDPVDLLIFAALKSELQDCTVVHLGVCDTFLTSLQAHVPETYWLQLSPAEADSRRFLDDCFRDVRAVVGPICAEMLAKGMKLELEAVVSALGSPSLLLQRAIEH